MKEIISKTNEYFTSNSKAILDEYYEYLRFKSISTDLSYQEEVKACATWVANYLKDTGFTVHQIKEGDGHPCIIAERISNPSAKTVLFYGHYDVQPVDPIELWASDPFTPTLRDGEVYARGAQDNKGQSFYVMRTLKTLKELNKLPQNLNIKLLIEGEEECGSKSLPLIIEKYKDLLKADYLYIVDCGSLAIEQPAITLGCRGIVTMTVTFSGSNSDLHSGEHGGIAYNPLHALVEILNKIRCGTTGKILIPGFYDKVSDLDPSEKSKIALDFDMKFYEGMFDAQATGGEKEFSSLESAWIRPTLEINGISGGYAGVGFKTVIPAKAVAKISCRLVPNQDPEEIAKIVTEHLRSICPKEIKIEFSDLSTNGRPIRNTANSKLHKITSQAITEATGYNCINILSGGSIPITALLAEKTGAEALFIGYGLPGDQMHAPNEHFGVDRLKIGHATIAAIIEGLNAG